MVQTGSKSWGDGYGRARKSTLGRMFASSAYNLETHTIGNVPDGQRLLVNHEVYPPLGRNLFEVINQHWAKETLTYTKLIMS